MTATVRSMDCSPEDVFAVIADGWVFPTWVVGASRMRRVDQDWPMQYTRLFHSFGIWPLLINDITTSLEWDPPRRAVMRPKGWPLGEALVTIEAKPRGNGTVVRMTEVPVAGPSRLVPKPIMAAMTVIRNREALQRLASIAEGQQRHRRIAEARATDAQSQQR